MSGFNEIQRLQQDRAECLSRIKLIPYVGSPEIKENASGKYLYVRKRIGSRLTSTYVGVYSDELYQMLQRNWKEMRELNKQLKKIDSQLAELGYASSELAPRIIQNIDFARANMKINIYDQAVLEGVATSFPQTEDIIENGKVNGMTATDVQKILNLKHAWEFILDTDVAQANSDYYLLCHVAKLVNEGFFSDGGRIRSIPVSIGGCNYVPPIPVKSIVKEHIDDILGTKQENIDTAIELCLYCMKAQIFLDGNKRASVIFANHYLISHGGGFLVIPEAFVPEFKKRLVAYYESEDIEVLREFMKKNCWKTF